MTYQTRMNGLRCAAAVGSGLLLWSAFPPHAQTESAYIALVPLLLLIRTSTPKQAFKWAWLAGMIFWCATLSWFPAIIKNGGPWALVFLGQFALSAWCALYVGLFAFASARVWMWAGASVSWRRVVAILLDPLLWVGAEYMRAHIFSGFAWNFLGVSQVQNIPLIQIASVLGVYGISAVLMLANGAIASIVWRMAEPFLMRLRQEPMPTPSLGYRVSRALESFVPIALVLACWVWGAGREQSWRENEHPAWRIALIQPNAPCVFVRDDDAREQQHALLLDLTRRAGLVKPDLMLWPESAAPEILPLSQLALAFVREGAEAANAPLLTGALEAEKIDLAQKATKDNLRFYNSAWLFATNGDPIGVYRKQHLVPFGEYIPFDKRITILQRLAPTGVSCFPGETSGVMTLTRENGETLKIGPLICFEDTVPDLSRNAVRDGARLLALVTNDAWFSGSIEPVQHLHQAIFRAVENGVPMVRCANSGVSCFVSPTGRVTMLDHARAIIIDTHASGVHSVRVPDVPLASPYTRYGDWPFTIPGVFLVVGLVLIHRKPRWPFLKS